VPEVEPPQHLIFACTKRIGLPLLAGPLSLEVSPITTSIEETSPDSFSPILLLLLLLLLLLPLLLS
jgi:hypothetical protein